MRRPLRVFMQDYVNETKGSMDGKGVDRKEM